MPLNPVPHKPTATKATPPRSGGAASKKAAGIVTERKGGEALGTLKEDRAPAEEAISNRDRAKPFPNITPWGK